MLFPAIPTAVQAEEGNTTTTLSVEPAIAISLPNTIAFDLTPSADGVFASSTASLAVSTNNETGYSLYFSTTNTDNSLHSQNPATTETIAAVSGSTTEENFENNTWGYNLSLASAGDATTYEAVPTSSETALLTTEAPSNDNYNLTFGAKVSTAMPSGTYTNTVAVSVVANPEYVPTLSQISNMQDMTNAICTKSVVNETKQLVDTRDGKSYWVTKLADGNCWMTQNLDFDIPADGLTSADSDVASTWNSSSAYPPTATSTTISSNSSYTGTLSWDLGMYVKSDPDGYSKYCDNVANLTNSSCTSAGWTNVSSMAPMSDGTSNVAISGNTYNAHYLVGNLYQWNAATAGTGGTISSTEATDSICPKGWHLPTSSSTYNSTSGSFYYLLNQYGLANTTSAGNYDITQSPLYFNPSGHVNSGSLMSAGSSGEYWSSIACYDTSGVCVFDFSSGHVDPSYLITRDYGFSVRCLAD